MKMIGVIGAGNCNNEIYELAREVGVGIARMGAILVCGGLGGVMEGACRGACEAGGQTVGILPGPDRAHTNQYVTIPIVTDLGHARNILVVRSSDILVAISGGYGTLSEISIALKLGKPVIGLHTWPNMEGIHYVTTPEDAIDAIPSLCLRRKKAD
ncbi:MAG: TIGR00725 family protein [Deltaproteobacteria bacterium]|nr:TIGR00725 family protein [Deltaproteobacteria bacterium]MBW1795028.1 TIGR00725 family protein [Deltaproteobacteria bacterium]MBW2330606.1 TIGR00725 family protein [Deltaproteobacteria bacterium]